jgi:hypothetical protein
VTTLSGVDSDDDGMPEDDHEGRRYNGFKQMDMPSSFVIGDSLAYSQRLEETLVDFKGLLDLDTEYPESEYLKDTKIQKWIRKIRKTTIDRQLFPVYTSMETMDKSEHDLTIEDMKAITFQVVPQFYWRYEQSGQDLYIHRVGRLEPVEGDGFQMYDMIGNVWEWVRDDWCDRISDRISGTDDNPAPNPMVENSGSGKKVIKGGAFDQLCRKTISSAREGLETNRCSSKFAS